MALTRRQFITRTGLITAGSMLGPSLFRNPFLRRALADTIGDRYFVVIMLDGGNDGLNTVVPYDNAGNPTGLRSDYMAARNAGGGGLQLPVSSLLTAPSMIDPNTLSQIGLHPGLQGLKNLYDLGKVAVIQGCGYPEYNLSHEVASRIWETGDPLGTYGFGTGWVGRYLSANYTPTDIPGVCIRDSISGELVASGTSVLAVRRLQNFGFPYDFFDSGDDQAKRDAFLAMCENVLGSSIPAMGNVGAAGKATLLSSESYPQLHFDYADEESPVNRIAFDDQYAALDNSTARDFREIAKIIYGVERGVPNVNARFFELRNGGYDTHSDQGANQPDGQQYGLHAELASALEVFYNDCADMGVADKLCIMIWSEFSRRIEQNDNGTDHGSQGPMFVIGGTVNGGVYGNHPNIAEAALDDEGNTSYSQNAGDGFRSTDFRDVYGTILKNWLNMPEGDISTLILPVDADEPGEERWTVANFDLSKDGGTTPLFQPPGP